MPLQKIHNLSFSTSKIEKTQKTDTSNLNQQASDFVLQAIQDNPNLKNNRSFMLSAIIANPSLISSLPPFLKNDLSFLKSLHKSISGIETTDKGIAKAQEANPNLKEDQLFMTMRLRSFGA